MDLVDGSGLWLGGTVEEPEPEVEAELGWGPFHRPTLPPELARLRRIRLEDDDLIALGVLE